jgi:hypothetical protein
MILSLDLGRMELALLSACQTGLGEVADGQCVQNLQRAFHVAGCRDVVASLWSVPDASTAALMDVFYEERLRHGRSPLEALRTAQLCVYCHPEWIRARAERGAPRPDKAMKLPKGVFATLPAPPRRPATDRRGRAAGRPT